jgi:hypothetical protein
VTICRCHLLKPSKSVAKKRGDLIQASPAREDSIAKWQLHNCCTHDSQLVHRYQDQGRHVPSRPAKWSWKTETGRHSCNSPYTATGCSASEQNWTLGLLRVVWKGGATVRVLKYWNIALIAFLTHDSYQVRVQSVVSSLWICASDTLFLNDPVQWGVLKTWDSRLSS